MKCPICGNKLEIKNKQIGTDNSGDPVFNEYAVCRDCKKQWNLDKQRAKKAAAKASAKKAEAADKTSRKKNESDVAQKKDENKIKKAHKEPEAAHTGSPKKRAAAEASPKASDRVKSPAQNQKRRPDEKAECGVQSRHVCLHYHLEQRHERRNHHNKRRDTHHIRNQVFNQ